MSGGDFISVNNLSSSSAGVITIDGHDIRDLNPYWLRRHIGTVSQVRKAFTSISYSFIIIVFIGFKLFSIKKKVLNLHLDSLYFSLYDFKV